MSKRLDAERLLRVLRAWFEKPPDSTPSPEEVEEVGEELDALANAIIRRECRPGRYPDLREDVVDAARTIIARVFARELAADITTSRTGRALVGRLWSRWHDAMKPAFKDRARKMKLGRDDDPDEFLDGLPSTSTTPEHETSVNEVLAKALPVIERPTALKIVGYSEKEITAITGKSRNAQKKADRRTREKAARRLGIPLPVRSAKRRTSRKRRPGSPPPRGPKRSGSGRRR